MISLDLLESGALEVRLRAEYATLAFVVGEGVTLSSFGAKGDCDAHKALSATSHAVILAGTIAMNPPVGLSDPEELIGWAAVVLPEYKVVEE